MANTFSNSGSIVGTGGLQLGSTGNKASKLIFGTGEVFAPSFGAACGGVYSALGSCQMTVANVAIGDKVFVMATSMPGGLILYSASANTGKIDLNFCTACAAVAAAWLTVQYLVMN